MKFVFFLTTAFYFVTLVALTRISSQRATTAPSAVAAEPAASEERVFKRRSIVFLSVLFAAVMFFLALVFPLVTQFLSDVYHYDVAQIGVLGSFTYFGGSILSLALGKIGDKHGKAMAVSVSMVLVAFALGIFVSVNNFSLLVLSSFFRGASFPMWAFIGATVGAIAPMPSRARWISVVQTTAQVTSILAPYAGGVLYAASPQMPFVITIAACLIIASIAQISQFKE